MGIPSTSSVRVDVVGEEGGHMDTEHILHHEGHHLNHATVPRPGHDHSILANSVMFVRAIGHFFAEEDGGRHSQPNLLTSSLANIEHSPRGVKTELAVLSGPGTLFECKIEGEVVVDFTVWDDSVKTGTVRNDEKEI